jgi:hypothetical protein
LIQCRLDLVIETGDEVIVVDWKSGRERRVGEFEVQLALYRRALAALRPGKRVKSLLFWLRSRESEELRAEFTEEQLLEFAAGVAGIEQALPACAPAPFGYTETGER